MRKNPNYPSFWDKKIRNVSSISKIDYITKDRISIIAKEIRKNAKILDIGFGYGFLEKRLEESKLFPQLTGIDISKVAVLRAKQSYSGNYFLARSSNLPFKNKFFEYVCLLEVLEHLDRKEAKTSLSEAKRVLQNNGTLIVSVPLFDKIYRGHPSGHVRVYTPDLILNELDKNGFIVIKTKYLFAFSSFYRIKSIISKIFPIKQPNNLIVIARKK